MGIWEWKKREETGGNRGKKRGREEREIEKEFTLLSKKT